MLCESALLRAWQYLGVLHHGLRWLHELTESLLMELESLGLGTVVVWG